MWAGTVMSPLGVREDLKFFWAGSRLSRSDRLFPTKKIHAAQPCGLPAADACTRWRGDTFQACTRVLPQLKVVLFLGSCNSWDYNTP